MPPRFRPPEEFPGQYPEPQRWQPPIRQPLPPMPAGRPPVRRGPVPGAGPAMPGRQPIPRPRPVKRPAYPVTHQRTAPRMQTPNQRKGPGSSRFLFGALALAALAGGTAVVLDRSHQPQAVAPQEQGGPERPLPAEFDQATAYDLNQADWNHMLGAHQEQAGGPITMRHTGEAILTLTEDQAGRPPAKGEYQANPPTNLGMHVQAERSGDVGFVAQLTSRQGSAKVSFLSSPNIRMDERMYHQPGIDVIVDGNSATVQVYAKRDQAIEQKILLPADAGPNPTIAVSQLGNTVVVTVNGVRQQFDLQAPVLGAQTWFGADTADTYGLRLKAYGLNGNKLSVANTRDLYPALHPKADGLSGPQVNKYNKKVGAAVDPARLYSDPEYAKFVIENFNEVATENIAKFQALQPQEGQFEFGELDQLVEWANAHGLEVRGHALLFTEAYPEWLQDKLQHANKDEARELLKKHITTVVGRYKGKIKSWDVLNEIFDPENYGQINKQSSWYKAYGDDSFIYDAMQFAYEADPEGYFGLNDWSMADPDRRGASTAVMREIKRRFPGIRVYVGDQAHIDSDDFDDDDTMNFYYEGGYQAWAAELKRDGIDLRITELSVENPGDPNDRKELFQIYGADCALSQNCIGIGVWAADNSEYSFTSNPATGELGDDGPADQKTPGGAVTPNLGYTGLKLGLQGKRP